MAQDDLIVEVGGWYETRDGQIAQAVDNNGTDIWEFDVIVDGEIEEYRADGRYYGGYSEHPLDLVKRIPAPSTNRPC